MSSDFLQLNWMDLYVYGDIVVNNMHNVMLFSGLIFLMVPLWSGVAFHTM